MNLSDYQFKSEFFKRRIAEEADKAEARGEARGRAVADAQAILTVLSARGITVGEEARARILACSDLATLERWLGRAATVAKAEDVLAP